MKDAPSDAAEALRTCDEGFHRQQQQQQQQQQLSTASTLPPPPRAGRSTPSLPPVASSAVQDSSSSLASGRQEHAAKGGGEGGGGGAAGVEESPEAAPTAPELSLSRKPPLRAVNLAGRLVPVVSSAGADARDDTPNYYDWRALFPDMEMLIQDLTEIAAECAQVATWKAWPEKHYDDGGRQDWKVFPFVHTFPAHDESRRTWVDSTCARCPVTSKLLRRLPNIRTALFSRLGGGSRISGHRGWADLANHVLRCHLPLKVPSDGVCGLWVNGEVRRHVEGEIIVFDDSKLHKAFNESSGERLVLIIDILRPPGVALGTADGDHTPELDAFIDAFR